MTERTVIAVAGAGGQLGLTLQALWPAAEQSQRMQLLPLSREQMDITRLESIAEVLSGYPIAAIINAAAYTAVDRAEEEREAAFAVNETGARNLASWAADNDCRLIQVSTDFVFDGCKQQPYQTDDATEPLSVYGASKLAGERAIQAMNPDRSLIFRTSWLYSPYLGNFVKTMLRLMHERDNLSVVNDQIGSPTSTRSLASLLIAALDSKHQAGVYHWSDGAQVSWYDFALAIQEEGLRHGILQQKIPVQPIPTSSYPTPATRPAYSVLDCRTTLRDFQCPVQNWLGELHVVVADLARAATSA